MGRVCEAPFASSQEAVGRRQVQLCSFFLYQWWQELQATVDPKGSKIFLHAVLREVLGEGGEVDLVGGVRPG